MELIVQVDKDERGNKGAALTTYISLAGRYLVLMPNNPRGGGVSRRVEGEERNELRDAINGLDVPEGMSVIARTAGIGRSTEELQWDLNYLIQLCTRSRTRRSCSRARSSSTRNRASSSARSAIISIPDIGELLIDTEAIFEQAQQFMSHVMPANVNRVKLYKDDVPLFLALPDRAPDRDRVRAAGAAAFGRRDRDRPHRGARLDRRQLGARDESGDIETTAFNTNLEAPTSSRASCGCATWAGSSSSTSSTWRARRTSAKSRTG
jgi:ribonuclease E